MHLEIDNNSTVSNFTKNTLLGMLKDYYNFFFGVWIYVTWNRHKLKKNLKIGHISQSKMTERFHI